MFDEWKWYSYRKYKAILYMEFAPYIVFFCMRLNIKPNSVTLSYALMGVLGGIFLAVPLNIFIFFGIILFFVRPFLDWSDGLLARETNQTSITGDMLDNYGAYVGWVALWAGMGLYLVNKSTEGILFISPTLTGMTTYIFSNIIYLTPVMPLLFAMNITMFAHSFLFTHYVNNETQQSLRKKPEKSDLRSKNSKKIKDDSIFGLLTRIHQMIFPLFEHNARTVDAICLLILIELLFPVFVTWIVFIMFLMWEIVSFLGGFYPVIKRGSIEDELLKKLGD